MKLQEVIDFSSWSIEDLEKYIEKNEPEVNKRILELQETEKLADSAAYKNLRKSVEINDRGLVEPVDAGRRAMLMSRAQAINKFLSSKTSSAEGIEQVRRSRLQGMNFGMSNELEDKLVGNKDVWKAFNELMDQYGDEFDYRTIMSEISNQVNEGNADSVNTIVKEVSKTVEEMIEKGDELDSIISNEELRAILERTLVR